MFSSHLALRSFSLWLAVVVAPLLLAVAIAGSRAQEAPTCEFVAATIVGTEGDDTLVGTDDVDSIVGLGGDDLIRGLANGDRICGGKGADEIYGGLGFDFFRGGPGSDAVRDRDHMSGFLGAGDDSLHRGVQAWGGPGDDTMVGFRRVAPVDFRGGPGDDVMIGTDACIDCAGDGDYLLGGLGDDVLRGRSKLNFIAPGPGRDVVYMGTRRHTWAGRVIYTSAPAPVEVDLEARIARGEGRDLLFGRITQTYGSRFGDVILGASGRQQLFGHRGADLIRGRAGADFLVGDRGRDSLHGGKGEDKCATGETLRSCEERF